MKQATITVAIVAAPRRRRASGMFLAFAAAALLHALALSVLVRRELPLAAVSQTQRAPLVVRLMKLPPDTQRMSDGSERPRAQALTARESSRKTRTARRDGASPSAPAVSSNTATAHEPPSIDWQSDLRSIGKNAPSKGNASARRPGSPSAAAAQAASKTQSDKLAREVSEAVRRDCRNAYAHLGLLAIPMLAADAFIQSGCKW